ncbi:MAG: hypothetical protein HYT80_04875 [Euryarchaeota archaeon]|nr:hypothetical protein [Euryarchaeota archaeon]
MFHGRPNRPVAVCWTAADPEATSVRYWAVCSRTSRMGTASASPIERQSPVRSTGRRSTPAASPAWSMSAATPATWGVAMEVPEAVAIRAP